MLILRGGCVHEAGATPVPHDHGANARVCWSAEGISVLAAAFVRRARPAARRRAARVIQCEARSAIWPRIPVIEEDAISSTWTRRSWLRAALAGTCALLTVPDVTRGMTVPEPRGRLALYNTHTRETADVTYRGERGTYDPDGLQALNRLLRCHFTGEVASIDPRAIEFIDLVDASLGGGHEIHIVSGYRSRKYNDWLRRRGHGVAKASLHLEGRAIDIRIPAVDLALVRRSALALARGGVGYYPASGFVHLDSGRVRSW
jgi:uncharacterized protein YcbK (DUF882 family)